MYTWGCPWQRLRFCPTVALAVRFASSERLGCILNVQVLAADKQALRGVCSQQAVVDDTRIWDISPRSPSRSPVPPAGGTLLRGLKPRAAGCSNFYVLHKPLGPPPRFMAPPIMHSGHTKSHASSLQASFALSDRCTVSPSPASCAVLPRQLQLQTVHLDS